MNLCERNFFSKPHLRALMAMLLPSHWLKVKVAECASVVAACNIGEV